MNTLYYLSKNLSFQMICLFSIYLIFSRDNILLRHLTSFIKVACLSWQLEIIVPPHKYFIYFFSV